MTTPAYPVYIRTRRWPPRNWYEMDGGWSIALKLEVPADYSDDRISITKGEHGGCVVSIHDKVGSNGVTMAPDFRKALPGAFFHDQIYCGETIRGLCEAWGWSAARVREWGDKAFREINLLFGLGNPIRRAYYAGVRWLGWPIFWAAYWWPKVANKTGKCAAELRDIWRAL